MATSSSQSEIPCLPSMPIPRAPVTPAQRIEDLLRALDPEDILYSPGQQKNIRAVINMYLKGELQVGEEVYVMDGQVVTSDECKQSEKKWFVEAFKMYRQ
ncbi:hypothetical protein MMC10_000530 [Thelotrema lepadinum]|nr:hypothetical protein [Thelotrema lepadinum]